MQLNELFKKPYQWQWVDVNEFRQQESRYLHPSTAAVAKFQASDNSDVVVIFGKDDIAPDSYDFTFQRKEKDHDDDEGMYVSNITGRGDAFAIFSTVLDIITDFIKRNNVNVLLFTGTEDSRQRLYQRMIKQLAQRFNMDYHAEDTGFLIMFAIFKPQFRETVTTTYSEQERAAQ